NILPGRSRACSSSRVFGSVYAPSPAPPVIVVPTVTLCRWPVSDATVRQELRVVVLPFLRFPDLLGRVEFREVDDFDVVARPLEGVLVDEGPRGVDAHRPREADIALRPLTVAGRAALRRLERLAKAAFADGQDVLLRIHPRGQRPQDILDVVDVDVLV